MALYLGSDRVKINLNRVVYRLNVQSNTSENIDGVLLAASDGGLLQDSNNLYLALNSINNKTLYSLDRYILTDMDGIKIISKEDK